MRGLRRDGRVLSGGSGCGGQPGDFVPGTEAVGHRQLGRRPGDWDDRRIVCVEGRGGLVGTGTPSYKGFRFPVEIISHCVWLYYRFPLSLREVEEMMLARGVTVSHETIRQWTGKFGQAYANGLRRRRLRPGDK